MKKHKDKTFTLPQYSDSCPVCDLVINGNSESQIKYNLKVHIMQKHNMTLDKAYKVKKNGKH